MSDPIHADPYTRIAYWQQRAGRAEATVTRLREHLEALARWAGEQNAGNAFAEQVRMWALARLAQDAEQGA